MQPLSSDQIEALIDGLCSAFWLKRPFRDFLRRSGVSPTDLRELDRQHTKRTFLRWLFERYEQSPRGQEIMRDIAVSLTAKTVFPDLDPEQLRVARIAIMTVRDLFPAASLRAQHRPTSATPAQERAPPRIDLDSFRVRLEALLLKLGTPDGGHEFESWFADLCNASGLKARGKYNTPQREFDGSLEVDSSIYLLEIKFTSDKSAVTDIANFRDKLNGHAHGALGIFVGMMGFTGPAQDAASRAGSPIILLDGAHLYRVLHGAIEMPQLIRRLRRHAVETGQAYLPVAQMG